MSETPVKPTSRLLLLFGLVCLVSVVLTNATETLSVIPGTGWGLRHGPWHNLDLISAIPYGAALVWALVLRIAARRGH